MMRIFLCATMMSVVASPLLAKEMTDKQKLRAEAEHVCYDDAQRLCSDTIPDETKTAACMKAKRASLSPDCGKVMDRGMGM